MYVCIALYPGQINLERSLGMRLCMYVCMYVCLNVFTIEIYGFTHSLHTFLACDAHDAIAIEIEVGTQRIEDNAKTSPEM